MLLKYKLKFKIAFSNEQFHENFKFCFGYFIFMVINIFIMDFNFDCVKFIILLLMNLIIWTLSNNFNLVYFD